MKKDLLSRPWVQIAREDAVLVDGRDPHCFYCNEPAVMNDLTPNPKASQQNLDEYQGEWTIVRTCRKCWGKIYSANIAKVSKKYGGDIGMMTLEMKADLLGGKLIQDRLTTARKGNASFVMVDGMIQPTGMVSFDDLYQWNRYTFTAVEMKLLQPAMALAYLHAPHEQVEMAMNFAMKDLDTNKLPVYRQVLALPENPEW